MVETVLTFVTPFLEVFLFAGFALISSGLIGLGSEHFFEDQKKVKGVALLIAGSVAVYAAAICFITLFISSLSQVYPTYLTLFVQPAPILIEAAITTVIVLTIVLGIEIRYERPAK